MRSTTAPQTLTAINLDASVRIDAFVWKAVCHPWKAERAFKTTGRVTGPPSN